MEVETDGWATKYRPRKLEDIVGQDHAVAKIRGMIKNNRIDPVIILTGETGHGKTCLARIIAYLINDLKYGTPTSDIQEINVGEDRGIDAVKKIVQSANYKPANKFRVIILDEVQALTGPAASAILKPLEEAPKKTVWILATNEPERLLTTIKGRCCVINLRAIQPKDMVPRLRYIANKEGREKLPDKLLLRIAEMSGGQPRSAIHILKNAVDTYVGAGGKIPPLEAVNRALSIAVSNPDTIAANILIGMYNLDFKSVVDELRELDSSNYAMVFMYLLNANAYVLHQRARVTDNWETIGRSRIIREVTSTLSMKRLSIVHSALINVRKGLGNSLVPEYHLALSELSQAFVELKAIEKKKVS